MARIQAIKQEHFVETQNRPLISSQLTGASSGVPKMHPIKSSNPVIKATSLIHTLRIKKLKLPRMHT